MPHPTTPSGAADAPLSRAPFLAAHTMDGHGSTSAVETICGPLPSPSHRPTPPSSPVEEPPVTLSQVKYLVKDAMETLAAQDGRPCSAERVVLALEKFVRNATSKSEDTPTTPSRQGDQLRVERGSRLEYKRVDEVYVLMSRKRISADTLTVGTKNRTSTRLSGQLILKPMNSINMCLWFGIESVSLSHSVDL